MSDIIQDAKQLLKLVDEERADLESRGAEPDEYGGFEMWLDSTVLYDNAKEVREAIKELAEETWEYQVQSRSMKRPAWKPSTNGILQKWYGAEDIEEAKGKARAYTPYFHGRENVEIRVLCRRVSPPEVINERCCV